MRAHSAPRLGAAEAPQLIQQVRADIVDDLGSTAVGHPASVRVDLGVECLVHAMSKLGVAGVDVARPAS